MSRQRWCCALCGNLTTREPRPDGRVLCAAHEAVALDEVPADPLTSLPTMAASIDRFSPASSSPSGPNLGDPGATLAVRHQGQARMAQESAVLPQKPGTALTAGGVAASPADDLSAPKREATSPADGMERC